MNWRQYSKVRINIKMVVKVFKYVFFIIGIGNDVQDSVLTTLATSEFPAARMDAVKFSEFFTWLSASASVVVNDNAGNNQAATPTIDWAQGFVIPTDAD